MSLHLACSSLRDRTIFVILSTLVLYVVAAFVSTGPATIAEQIKLNEGL